MLSTLVDAYEAYREDPAFSHLRTDGIVLVPGEGDEEPSILIVGKAPGATENLARRPFVGAEGKVIRSLIADVAGLDPLDYFLTNVVKYRLPGNRAPDATEITSSVPHLRAEYAALGSPPVIVAVGAVAFQSLRPGTGGILAVAGKRLELAGGASLWPMADPSHGIRNPEHRPIMEAHWEAFGEWFRKEYR